MMAAANSYAAVVVFQGGRQVQVARYTMDGSYVVLEYQNGRKEMYPVSAIDLKATQAAAAAPTAPPTAAAGPHSPFLGARSETGKGGVSITDADVKHIERPTPAGAAGEKEAEKEGSEEAETASGSGQVVLVGYERRRLGETEWEIKATVTNRGTVPVTGVSASMRVLDGKGMPIATGFGTLPGRLDPGKQGVIIGKVNVESEPTQVAVDLLWQKLTVPTKTPPAASRVMPGATRGLSVPPGSSPNTVPGNPMTVPPTSVAPSAAQAPPPTSS
jgi:hypothetical protein